MADLTGAVRVGIKNFFEVGKKEEPALQKGGRRSELIGLYLRRIYKKFYFTNNNAVKKGYGLN
jgi:hypothetical protein